MEKILDYHDASINKIEYLSKENKLVVGIETYEETLYDLSFIDVIGWDFSLEFQNHLLDFRTYDSSNLNNLILENYEVEPKYVESMKASKGYFFELDPATGLGGYIIANDFQVKKINT